MVLYHLFICYCTVPQGSISRPALYHHPGPVRRPPPTHFLAGMLSPREPSFSWPPQQYRQPARSPACCPSAQVLLGDRPGNTTAQRLADAIWANCSPFILGSIPAAVASAIIVSSSLDAGAATPLAAGAAALLPLAAAAWPVAAPLLEISRFAGMSAAEIEETVQVKEPVQVGEWFCSW